jgi:transposase
MRPRTKFTPKQVQAIQLAMQQARNRSAFQRLQCLWLRTQQEWSTIQIAGIVGFSESHVRRVWSEYLRCGLKAAEGKPKGGRRHQHLTADQESALLKPFVGQAMQGRALTARDIKRSYEERVGKTVPESTVCRLLARHGWRRVQPRPKHPRRNKKAQAAFKKTPATGPRRGGFLPPEVVAGDV